jgi:uncharacterized protein (DUF4415 family)
MFGRYHKETCPTPTPSKTDACTQMMYEREELQTELFINWTDESLPHQWTGMDLDHPVERHQTRVTIRMDSDMLAWFRKLGPGHQKRVNRVPRVNWLALICGHVKGYPSDDVLPRMLHEARPLQERVWTGL